MKVMKREHDPFDRRGITIIVESADSETRKATISIDGEAKDFDIGGSTVVGNELMILDKVTPYYVHLEFETLKKNKSTLQSGFVND